MLRYHMEVKMLYIWTNDQKSNVCDRCKELHGRFFRENELPQFPLHENCRCSLMEISPEEAAKYHFEKIIKN